jgi:Fe-S-cluster containining protein
MKPKCMRCGSCCRNYNCIVPKNEDSNLSDEFIEKLSIEKGHKAVFKYIEDNSIPQGEKCKWLNQNKSIAAGDEYNDVANCNAYDRRCNMCIDHMSDQWCATGLIIWRGHKLKGNEVPLEIMEIIEQNPRANIFFRKD